MAEQQQDDPQADPAVPATREREETLDVDLGGAEDGLPGEGHGGSPPPPPREYGQDREGAGG